MYFELQIFTLLFLTVTTSYAEPNFYGKKIDAKNFDEDAYPRINSGLAGGQNASVKQINYIGSLLSRYGSLLGSVVVLNKKWLVTAAFNVYLEQATDLKVRLGSNFYVKGGKVLDIDKAFLHPNYTGEWDFDIGLIKLKKPVKFSRVIKNIKLGQNLPKNGENAIVAGFGYLGNRTMAATLQKASVPFVDYNKCKELYSESDFTKFSFCTSKSGVGPCTYDWGSPLVYKNKLIGVFSGSYECGSTKYPAVYADVTKFRSWIYETIKKHSDDFDENPTENMETKEADDREVGEGIEK